MRVPSDVRAAGADEEVEVGAGLGLGDVVDVEAGPPSGRVGEGGDGLGVGDALQELVVRDLDVDAAGVDVETDDIAGAHEGERPAGGGFGADVQHDGAVGGAAHAAVAHP